MFRGPRQFDLVGGGVFDFLWAHVGGAVVVASGGDEDIKAPGSAAL